MSVPAIEVREVHQTYATPAGPVDVLSGVDLAVTPGEVVAVCGPSGSGKSTLLNLMALLDEPTRGTVTIGGVRTSDLSGKQRDRLRSDVIGFVFQEYHLIPHLTALGNVMLALAAAGVPRRQRREIALAELATVGLAHRADARPTTLSGGEQQRVSVARALARRPAVLLCDEPTGSLDARATDQLVAHLAALAEHQAVAVVIVTHDDAVAARAHRALDLSAGRLSARRGSTT